MSYRLTYQGVSFECDTVGDVIAILGYVAPRPGTPKSIKVPTEPKAAAVAEPERKAEPPVKDGGRVATCSTCDAKFSTPKFGPTPKYCLGCRAAGKMKPKPKAKVFKDDVPLGKQ